MLPSHNWRGFRVSSPAALGGEKRSTVKERQIKLDLHYVILTQQHPVAYVTIAVIQSYAHALFLPQHSTAHLLFPPRLFFPFFLPIATKTLRVEYPVSGAAAATVASCSRT